MRHGECGWGLYTKKYPGLASQAIVCFPTLPTPLLQVTPLVWRDLPLSETEEPGKGQSPPSCRCVIGPLAGGCARGTCNTGLMGRSEGEPDSWTSCVRRHLAQGGGKEDHEWNNAVLETHYHTPVYSCLKEFLCGEALAQQGRCVSTDGSL